MSNEKSKAPESGTAKPAPKPSSPATAKVPPAPSAPIPPLYRGVDWLAFAVTTLLTFIAYFLTIAPDLTLEDSGELAVGSMYAGVPHPPGYPVWTVFTWLFTKLLPMSNIAWRVSVASAVVASLSNGLLALLVSRGSSMFIEGIEELKGIDRRAENVICLMSGYVAGMLMGFNGYMWSQAVIVEVYPISVLSLMGVLCCLLRWMHAPEQRRYLYWMIFLFGVSITNHQTLIVAAMGLELAVAARDQKQGAYLFAINSAFFVLGLLFMSMGELESIAKNPGLFRIFCAVGIGSIILTGWLIVKLDILEEMGIVVVGSIFVAGVCWLLLKIEMPFIGIIRLLLFIAGIVWFLLKTKGQFTEFKIAILMGILFFAGASFYFYMPVASMSNPPMNWGYARTREGFFHALSRGQYEKTNPTDSVARFAGQIEMYANGAKEEFNLVYLAIALIPLLWLLWRMVRRSNLQWLTWVFGSWAIIRAIIGLKGHEELFVIGEGILYTSAILLAAVVPLVKVFTHKPTDRPEESWLAGLSAVFLCLALLLMALLNPNPDRQSTSLTKVFFTSSHIMVAMCIGYGLALMTALMTVNYQRVRLWLLAGCTAAGGMALYAFLDMESSLPRAIFTAKLGVGMAVVAVLIFAIARVRAPLTALMVFSFFMPSYTMLSHWADNEQRGHLFGFWFGHDMFTPPFTAKDGKLSYDPKERTELLSKPETAKLVYPEMARDAVLFGGTDPGRFCPTYMIFCESFIKPEDRRDPNFDRRDVYIITQNALADATYLMYIRAHYNRSTQIDQPFFQELVRSEKQRLQNRPTALSKIVSPLDTLFTNIGTSIERSRRSGSSFFNESDFTDVKAISARLRPGGQQDALGKYLFEACSKATQDALASDNESALRSALTKDWNVMLARELIEKENLDQELAAIDHRTKDLDERTRKKQELTAQFQKGNFTLFEAARFTNVVLSAHVQRFVAENPQSHTRIRLNRLLLEAVFPKEIVKSQGGVYPDREIKTPTPDDSQVAFKNYMDDVTRRKALNQLEPGENFETVRDPATGQERVSVSGQVAVMGINGMLTKTIFDNNPTHEFYVEESFPLKWMYPHLTPHGIIMKINRQPQPELTQEIVDRDHYFWTKFSARLIGDWINYDTSVSNICNFCERVYKHGDFTDFKGDPRFIRDDDAQKAFSKLRSAQAGMYYWRINEAAGRPAVQQRMIKEADFAFKQSFAYCPFSPEAVYRYTNLLLSQGRIDDALLIAQTFKKLDPRNASAQDLINNLSGYKQQQAAALSNNQLSQLISQHKANPGNLNAAVPLLQAYAQASQTNQAIAVLDTVLANSTNADLPTLLNIASIYPQIGAPAKRQSTLAIATQFCDRFMTNGLNDPGALMNVAEVYRQAGNIAKATDAALRAVAASDKQLANPQADAATITRAAQVYNAALSLGRAEYLAPLERIMTRLVQVMPTNPEAWYDLAAVQVAVGKTNEAVQSVGRSMSLSRQRPAAPGVNNLEQMARQDARFANLQKIPEFQKLFVK